MFIYVSDNCAVNSHYIVTITLNGTTVEAKLIDGSTVPLCNTNDYGEALAKYRYYVGKLNG